MRLREELADFDSEQRFALPGVRVADPKALDLESAWDAEWQKNIWEIALAGVKAQFKPKQFQMFDLYALRKVPVTVVARLLGSSVAKVYLVKHRLSKLLRKAVADFEKVENRH